MTRKRRNATLVWSSENHMFNSEYVLDNTGTCNNLIDKVFAFTGERSKRLTITKHKYFYAPSEEYKNFVIRFKRTK